MVQGLCCGRPIFSSGGGSMEEGDRTRKMVMRISQGGGVTPDWYSQHKRGI